MGTGHHGHGAPQPIFSGRLTDPIPYKHGKNPIRLGSLVGELYTVLIKIKLHKIGLCAILIFLAGLRGMCSGSFLRFEEYMPGGCWDPMSPSEEK